VPKLLRLPVFIRYLVEEFELAPRLQRNRAANFVRFKSPQGMS
jgi:hypothetical protein